MTDHEHQPAPVDCFCDSCGRIIAKGEPTVMVCTVIEPERLRLCKRCASEWGFDTEAKS